MATTLTSDPTSALRIRRPLTSSLGADVDANVKSDLDELNTLLAKRVFPRPQGANGANGRRRPHDVRALIELPLEAKRDATEWPDRSLGHWLSSQHEDAAKLTLAEYIDRTADLSALKYDYLSNPANWLNLDYNTRTVLNGAYLAISDYLIASAFLVMDVQDVNGVKNFILGNTNGAKNIVNYAIVSTARAYIDEKRLKVPQYRDDKSAIVADIKAANLSMASASFKTSLQSVIDAHILNSDQTKLIDEANIGDIPDDMKLQLVQYIQNSKIPITKANVNYFLPLFISQLTGTTQVADSTAVDVQQSDKDFDIDPLTDDSDVITVSRSAVLCASQLYYGMILGDELDIFSVVNYFTHKYLVRGGIEVQDSHLRDDLQTYVFSNRFTNRRTSKIVDRTRPAERQMFYRQVFDYGNAQITEDVIVNKEFGRLWKVLMLEAAKYIERAQVSPNPGTYVSRQNVSQAVEDLQYNLSTHCTGMANVITPLIYAELDFVIYRILMHPEVVRQIVPTGGSWWRVVETLYMGMKNVRPRATVLYNKAKFGHDIIRSFADYDSQTFEDDTNFFPFLSNVEAFITTQSILQESQEDDLKKGDDAEEEAAPASPAPPAYTAPKGMPEQANGSAAPSAHAGADEWDF